MELKMDVVVSQQHQLVDYRGEIQLDHCEPQLTCTKSRSGRPLRRQTGRHVLQERSRQKRQILQGMARPLKRWLIRHRDNPYPTKAEKIALAVGSQMTLIQVSNWFANARRRLKNTVNTPDAGWAKRIKLYNSCVVGNAELLSISSDDSIWDSEEDHCYSAPEGSNPTRSFTHETKSRKTFVTSTTSYPTIPQRQCKRCCEEEDSDVEEESGQECRPNKYKRTIMQRYLHDSRDHHHHPVVGTGKEDPSRDPGRPGQKGGDSIGSFSDSDHSSTSQSHSGSSTDFRQDFSFSDDEIPYEEIQRRIKGQNETSMSKESRYWKEFDAAIVLISLSHCVSSRNNSSSIKTGSCNSN